MPCSFLLNFDTSLENVFFKSKIPPPYFLIINITIVVFSLLNALASRKIKSKYAYGLFCAYNCLFDWIVMMLIMTCNVYLLTSYIFSRFMCCLLQSKIKTYSCCDNK